MHADQTRRELRILNTIAEELNGAVDVRQALERTLRLVARLLGLPTGWIWLIDPDTKAIYNAAAYNLPPYLQDPVKMSDRWCQCTDAFRSGSLRPKNVDVIECSRLAPAVKQNATDLTAGLRYHATIPLYFRSKPLGIINLTGPSWRKLTSAELRVLSTIALQVGATIERARLAEDAARLAAAEERARIAREIHDTLAQSFTAIALQLEGALNDLGTAAPHAGDHVRRALATARDGIAQARTSMAGLRAASAGGRPLVQALHALARAVTSETGLRVLVDVCALPELGSRAEAEIYRIVGEALRNAAKHAKATEVRVVLRRRAARLRLEVSDDGTGMEPAAQTFSGHGIVGMQERARLLGGALRLRTRRAHGTTVIADIPLDAVSK